MYKLLSIFLMIFLAPVSEASDTRLEGIKTIEVFHSNDDVIKIPDDLDLSAVKVKKYNLDSHKNMEKYLRDKIVVNGKGASQISSPQEIEKAKEIVRKLVEDMKRSGKMQNLWEGVIIAKRYGLTKYPAVVFNGGKEVVYGVTNVALAIDMKNGKKIQIKEGRR